MNASFVVQAALILAGALLLRPGLLRAPGRSRRCCWACRRSASCSSGSSPATATRWCTRSGPSRHLVGGGLGLIALAYAVRPRSEVLGTTLALLGLVGTAATVFFLTGVTEYLGEGGTERVAAYVHPRRAGRRRARAVAAGRPRVGRPAAPSARRPAREQAERARERDAALEAAARRKHRGRTAARPTTADEDDLDDHWAPVERRRD